MKNRNRQKVSISPDRIGARAVRDGELIQSVPPLEGGSLDEIARRIGREARTLRSWMGAPYGLLPSAERRGRGVEYSAEFERRARLIARLLDVEELSLSEVSERLARRGDMEVLALLAVKPQPNRTSSESAADYAARVRKSGEKRHEDQTWGMRGSGWSDSRQVAGPPSRTEWETVFVQDGLELNIRRPIEKSLRKKIGRILSEARRILREP